MTTSFSNVQPKIDILLVEDDPITGDAICSALGTFGFTVKQVLTAEECFSSIKEKEPVILLLDLELPDLSGDKICHILREQSFHHLPIIALSGKDSDDSIVNVLEAGADDFVSKKNSISILVAHIRSVLKRGKRVLKNQSREQIVNWGPFLMDRRSMQVKVSGKEISLTPTEFQLLETFLAFPGTVYTRRQLIESLHGAGYSLTERTIDVHINGIRSQLGEHRKMLETVRGVGYRLMEQMNQ